jgi:hypothetical protein
MHHKNSLIAPITHRYYRTPNYPYVWQAFTGGRKDIDT